MIYAALVVEAPEIIIEFEKKTLTTSKEPIGFLLIGLSFALSSTLSLAKLVRDRQDATYFENNKITITGHHKPITTLMERSHNVYGFATWVLFILDCIAFFYSVQRFNLTQERSDLLILGISFLVYSCFILSKAVRDNLSTNTTLHPSSTHWIMYVVAPFIALFFTMEGLWEIPLEVEQKVFMVITIVCIMSVTFNLAKVVRDRQEIIWLTSNE